MPTVIVKAKKKVLEPLQRFIGEEARVMNREYLAINNFILAETLEVSLPEDIRPEDQGMLYLFPVADNQFCLQLCFLQYAGGSLNNASVCSLKFLPAFFDQYPPETLMANQPFRFDRVTEQQFNVCAQSRILVSKLNENSTKPPFIHALQQAETAIHLLRRTLECITTPFTVCQVPACRFLAYESEREKIMDARFIIEQQIEHPHTIKELARKVAMNECYLKKGFKALIGTTIHEYQQNLRMAKARELLQRNGFSVTDVANTLGFSSISHFSTAFKRVTGMKPCELLS